MILEDDGAIKKAVANLKQGLLTDNQEISDKAASELFAAGSASVPVILGELNKIDLPQVADKRATNQVGGLVAVLRDIDECASDSFLRAANSQDISSILRICLQNVQKFSLQNYRQARFGKILLLEQKSLSERYKATAHVMKWLASVPSKDLRGIKRIYILKDRADFDYLGTYAPNIAKIAVIWKEYNEPRSLLGWLPRLGMRQTLYHEIGHHRFRHTYGQDLIEERIAEEYSILQIGRAMPSLKWLARIMWAVRRRKRQAKLFWFDLEFTTEGKKYQVSVESSHFSLVRAAIDVTDDLESQGFEVSKVEFVAERILNDGTRAEPGIRSWSERTQLN